VVTLWGRQWTREELLARVGRLEQVAGIWLVEGGDDAERGVRMLRCRPGAGFELEILVDCGTTSAFTQQACDLVRAAA
jgi:hypothetical protein